MTAHVLAALMAIMCAKGVIGSAHAQTVSEELWVKSVNTTSTTAESTQNQPNASKTTSTNKLPSNQPNKPSASLPYCTDVQADSSPPAKGSTLAVGNTLSAVANQDLILKGRSCIQRDTIQLQGDDIHYDYASEQVTVKGNAQVIKPDGGRITGDAIQYNLANATGRISPAQFEVESSQGHGSAESLSILSARRALLSQARYTTCQADDPDWYIKSDSLILDQDHDVGIGRNTALVFKGVPILGSPYMKFPLGNRRQSGFLTPTIGYSSLNGTSIAIPYYFNLAPNYDFTLTPENMTQRGLRVGGEYRYLTPWGQGNVTGEVLPHDEQTGEKRYYWHYQHLTQGNWANGVWQAKINAQKTSDNSYADDFGITDWDSGSRALPSEFSLSYKTDALYLRLRRKAYQTLQTESNQVDVPYDFEPQLEARYKTRWDNLKFNTQYESTRFTHSDTANKAQGWRHTLYPSLAYDWRTPSAFIVPKMGLHMTRYQLSSIPAAANVNNIPYDKNASRTLPIFSLDSGMVFERKDVWFKQNITQTLEPRVYYAYIPYKNQSQIWNFDSALADLDFSRIYSENLFTGTDRIAQANQVTTGVTSRILGRDSGEELFQFSVAQRYYFSKQTVALSGIVENNNVFRKSDLLAGASGKIANQLWAQAFGQYNSESGKMLRTDGAIRWQPGYRKVFNLGYHENKILTEPSKSAYASAQFPVSAVSNNLYAVARLNYNLNNHRTTDAWAGFEYAKDCWIVRLVGQHSVTSDNRIDNSVSLQLVLKGLGNLGNHTDDQLSTRIDGYHPSDFR